ncbi:MAG: DEAD/DEAH box helicase [archaeon]
MPESQASKSHSPECVDKFRQLGIAEPVLNAIAEQGFEMPSEIQRKSIQLVVSGKDVIAEAATGSGKTLAFDAGIIQNTEPGYGLQALILTPTRELAEQNARALRSFSKYKPLHIVTIYGGVPINKQIHLVRTADVVVATPGRLLDHMERGTIQLNEITILVLDEADTMLDMGFIRDVRKIMQACPRSRQTLLFSATITREVARLSHDYMRSPQQVFAEPQVDPKQLAQVYYEISSKLKFSLLAHLLMHEDAKLVMVFCNTRRFVDIVARNLNQAGIDAMPIHGGLTQSKRGKTLHQFHSQATTVLVCTDVAARGLDIPHVSHIYNYDLPKESKQYIHRIGRTARAGKEGKVINLLSERDHDAFRQVLHDNGVKVTRMAVPPMKRIEMQQTGRRDYRQGNDRRRNPHKNYSHLQRRQRSSSHSQRAPSRGSSR